MDTIAEILDLQRTQNTGTEKGKRTSNMMPPLLSFFKNVLVRHPYMGVRTKKEKQSYP
jgi:hypothetical protein